jgi:hypothetical protein
VPADGPRTVEDAFPVPEDDRVVYSALLQEGGVVVGSRAVEVPDVHTAHAVEAAVYEDSVDWELRVH